jgi:hypothetical protein
MERQNMFGLIKKQTEIESDKWFNSANHEHPVRTFLFMSLSPAAFERRIRDAR